MTDCLLGGINNSQAYAEVINYFKSSATLAGITWDIIWPGQKPPALEDRNSPFIMLSVVEISREQEYIGSRELITDKSLLIELWFRDFTGSLASQQFADFVDSLGLITVNKVAYMTPRYLGQNKFKGWVTIPASLPFRF